MSSSPANARRRTEPLCARSAAAKSVLTRSLRRAPEALSIVVASLLVASGCGQLDTPVGGADPDPERVESTQSAVSTTCAWDPGFGTQGSYQSDWWFEFSVKDSSTSTMQVEVSGTPSSRILKLGSRFAISGGYVKFTGGTGNAPVAAGTLIRLLATQSAAKGGKTANSAWFPYRQQLPVVDCQACAPKCATDTCGSDGCGGKCACATGTVCLSNLTCCHPNTNTCGPDGCGGSHGACACVPSCPTDTCGSDGCGGTCACATGAVCLTSLTCCHPNTNTCGPDGCGGSHGACACVPSCTGKQCGDDGCGGSCGTCATGTACSAGACVSGCVAPWSPLWLQTSNAGTWWAEYQVAGGGSVVRTLTLEVVGKGLYPLDFAYGRFAGGLDGVASGSTVILHATDATGASAQTLPYRYLVDKAPATDPCKGTPSTSSCKPLTRGLVTFSMDDSYESQNTLARPLLAKYGFKATINHITYNLESYGLLPSAKALAADGNEIASHTRTHPDLTSLSTQGVIDELNLSKQYLLTNVGTPVESFASPMGSYNDSVIALIKRYYSSHRTVNPGLNYVGTDVYQLNADGVFSDSTVSAVCAQLTEAATYKGWRILVFHEFTTAASTTSSLTYPIASFEGILKCAQATAGLDVVVTRQGTAAIVCGSP